MKSLFSQALELFHHNFYPEVEETFSYIIAKSAFKDEWYNYILPKVEEHNFDWRVVEEFRQQQKQSGFRFSYAIPKNVLGSFSPVLLNKGLQNLGSDCYMWMQMQQSFPHDNYELEFEMVDDDTIDTLVQISNQCFPQWENNTEFTRFAFQLSKKITNLDFRFSNVIVKKDNKVAAFGMMMCNRNLDLGYLYSVGTLEDYRRQGLFSAVTKYLCNVSFDFGAKQIFSIVEKNGASYRGFSKLGFTPKEQYNLYYETA